MPFICTKYAHTHTINDFRVTGINLKYTCVKGCVLMCFKQDRTTDKYTNPKNKVTEIKMTIQNILLRTISQTHTIGRPDPKGTKFGRGNQPDRVCLRQMQYDEEFFSYLLSVLNLEPNCHINGRIPYLSIGHLSSFIWLAYRPFAFHLSFYHIFMTF